MPHWKLLGYNPEQKILVNSGRVAGYTPAYTYLQNTKALPLVVGKTRYIEDTPKLERPIFSGSILFLQNTKKPARCGGYS